MSIGIYKWGWGDGSENVAFWGWIGGASAAVYRNAFVPSIVMDSNRVKVVI
ncbi:MAG: hypothetical protein HZB22_08010 [Deltaproteobacteria bacterium]|nr:hypothetical protein [Deltaproteobacteria bacterium]